MGEGAATAGLIGRDAELAELLADFEAAGSERMAAVILGGDAGVGKTRLVTEFAAVAEGEGAIVLTGRGIDIEDAPPFWPVISALRHAVRTATAATRRADDREVADLLGPRLARLDELSAETGPRVQILEALYRTVVELARRRVVVLVVEDLQWVDRSTRDFLVYLVASLTTERVLLVGTYRTAGDAPGIAGTLVELRRHRQVSWRELAPFTRDALAGLVEQWAPDRPGLEPLVWQRSVGNAFIAEETVRAVLAGDALGLPATLRELVLNRVGSLPATGQLVARAVAVSSGPLPHPLLAEVVELPAAELLDAVRAAAGAGVVVVDEQFEGYRLRHGLMTEVIVADLLPGERIELHRRYATALSEVAGTERTSATPPGHGEDPAVAALASSARLAHHWQHAGAPERALTAIVAAAQAAERIRGYAEAHRHWLRAAELTAGVPAAARVLPHPECLERAAEAAHLAGEHNDAVALLEQRLAGPSAPADHGAPADAASALLTARLGRYLHAAGHSGRAARAYRTATSLLPEHGMAAERAEVLAGHAAVLLQGGEFAAAGSVAKRALQLSRVASLPSVQARVLAILGFSRAYLADTEKGSSALVEALAVAERTGVPTAIGEAYLRRAELLSGPLNQLVDGVACAREGAARVAGLGLARTAGVALLALAANGLFRLGQWDDAERAVAQAWQLEPTGGEALEVRLARCRLDVGRGRFGSAEHDLAAVELLTASSAGPRHRLPLLVLRAGLEMWRSHPDLAVGYVEEGLDLVELETVDIWLVAPLLWHGTRAWAETMRLGLPTLSAEQTRRLRGHCAELVRRSAGTVPAVREVVATYAAMCAAETARAEGRSDPEAWAQVAQLLEQRDQPYPAAYARLRRAEALFAERARSAAATAELLRAERAARGLGAVPLLAEITDLARRARVQLDPPDADDEHIPSPRRGAESALDALTARELEVLTELASGLTNRQIAGRLFISEKTVGVHVSRIFAKIGVHSRVQASALLHRARPSGGESDAG